MKTMRLFGVLVAFVRVSREVARHISAQRVRFFSRREAMGAQVRIALQGFFRAE